jgi:hypothetical protein
MQSRKDQVSDTTILTWHIQPIDTTPNVGLADFVFFPHRRGADGYDGGIVTTITLGSSATTASWTPDVDFDPAFTPVYFVEIKPVFA